MRLTDATLRTLELPSKGQKTHFDETLKGLGFRLSQGGTRTFVLMHGPNRELVTLGRYPVITLAQARTKAKELLAERTLGKHRPDAITWDAAKEAYLDFVQRKNRPRTHADYTRLLDKHFIFGRQKLADITPGDINRRLDKLADTPSEHNHTITVVKIFFRWAQRKSYIERSPCENLQLTKSTPRERVLSDDELKAVWTACDKAEQEPHSDDALRLSAQFTAIVKLLILTGQRRTETASLRAGYIAKDFSTITLPAELTKNGRVHEFPVGALCRSILEPCLAEAAKEGDVTPSTRLFPSRSNAHKVEDGCFTGWSKCKSQLETLSGTSGWTLHDIRRTVATRLAELGVAPHVIERLLNHVTGTLSPIARVYNRASFLAEMRTAIDRWEAYLQEKILV